MGSLENSLDSPTMQNDNSVCNTESSIGFIEEEYSSNTNHCIMGNDNDERILPEESCIYSPEEAENSLANQNLPPINIDIDINDIQSLVSEIELPIESVDSIEGYSLQDLVIKCSGFEQRNTKNPNDLIKVCFIILIALYFAMA